jgi:hypothetical protein
LTGKKGYCALWLAVRFHAKGKIMKRLGISAFALGLLCTPVLAQTMDMSTVKCRDMAANTAEKNAMVLMWLQGYYAMRTLPRSSISTRWVGMSKSSVNIAKRTPITASSRRRTKAWMIEPSEFRKIVYFTDAYRFTR